MNWFSKFFYRNTWCRFGIHHGAIHHDEWGIAGHWTCPCCKYDSPAIVWPEPPKPKNKNHPLNAPACKEIL